MGRSQSIIRTLYNKIAQALRPRPFSPSPLVAVLWPRPSGPDSLTDGRTDVFPMFCTGHRSFWASVLLTINISQMVSRAGYRGPWTTGSHIYQPVLLRSNFRMKLITFFWLCQELPAQKIISLIIRKFITSTREKEGKNDKDDDNDNRMILSEKVFS